MIRGAIFDLGSTLIHFEGDWDKVWQASLDELEPALREAGAHSIPAGLGNEFGRRMRAYRQERLDDHRERTTETILLETLADLGGSAPEPEIVRAALERVYARSERCWKAVPHLIPTLNELRRTGLRMALLSNAGDEANVQRLIDQAGIRKFFDPILISAAIGVRKPASQPFMQILTRWKLAPQQVVMIGDRLDQDIRGAQQAGMHQLWLQQYADPGQERLLEPELTADSLDQVPAQIERLNMKG